MANTKTGCKSTPNDALNFEEIAVDTDPGANGYASEPVRGDNLHFYIKSVTGTVTLQWKANADSSWTDYGDYTAVARKKIDDNTVQWRVIVKDNNQNGTAGIRWDK